jgi:transcriptional regulator with XRE-family HTH domain
MITAAQLRAARGLLDWSRSDLSKASKVSQETIKNIEHGVFRPQETTEEAIIGAFAAQGVEFTDGNGVRRVRDSVLRLEGVDGFKRFVDSVYETARLPYSPEMENKLICISNVNESLFSEYLGDYLPFHVRRMNEIKDLKFKVLVKNPSGAARITEARDSQYRECRQIPGDYTGNVPFYVYGNSLAILIFDEKPAPQIVIISSPLVAKAYREQFDIMWSYAKPLKA